MSGRCAAWRWCALPALVGTAVAGCAAGEWSTTRTDREVRAASLSDASASGSANPIMTVPVQSRPWEFAGHAGQIITIPNYRVYTTLTRQSVLDRLPLFLERAMEHYTTALAPLP